MGDATLMHSPCVTHQLTSEKDVSNTSTQVFFHEGNEKNFMA